MNKTRPFLPGLILILFLSACTIPTGFGDSVSLPFEENGVSGELFAEAFKQLDFGLEGSGHYVVVPSFTKEKGYKLSVSLQGKENMHLRIRYTGEKAPEKEELTAILEKVHLHISPQSDCFAWWQEGEDDFFHLYHFLPQGQPFLSKEYVQKFEAASGKLPNWDEVSLAKEVVYQKIMDTSSVYNSTKDGDHAHLNSEFWEMLDEITDDEKLDEVILKIWPTHYRAEDWVKNRCENGATFSENWKEQAVQKAWQFTNKESSRNLIYAIGSERNIDKLDAELIGQWPRKYKPLEQRLGNAYPQISEKRKQELHKKCKKVVADIRFNPTDSLRKRNLMAADLHSATWVAKHLDDKATFDLAAGKMVPFWPESYAANDFLEEYYTTLKPEQQEAFLERSEAALADSSDQGYRLRVFLEDYAPCDRLTHIMATHPGAVSDSVRRCR